VKEDDVSGYVICKGGSRNTYKILENLKIDLDIVGGIMVYWI